MLAYAVDTSTSDSDALAGAADRSKPNLVSEVQFGAYSRGARDRGSASQVHFGARYDGSSDRGSAPQVHSGARCCGGGGSSFSSVNIRFFGPPGALHWQLGTSELAPEVAR